MSDSTPIFRQACRAEVHDQIRNQVLVNRLTATSSKITKISRWEILINYQWNWHLNMYNLNDFVCCIPQMKREFQASLHQSTKFPANIDLGKHNSMGHLLPCAIDFKTNHPHIHLQWIGKLGIATQSRHVISMGPRQPEVPGEAIVCSDL